MMENCNYGYNEMPVLQMARAGMFGELSPGAAAYNHDLREILFENKVMRLWRRAYHTRRNSNLYPTHGLGPVAFYFDINRGDRFDTLVSMSTPSLGLGPSGVEDHEPTGSSNGRRSTSPAISTFADSHREGRCNPARTRRLEPPAYSRINSPGNEGHLRGLSTPQHLSRGTGGRGEQYALSMPRRRSSSIRSALVRRAGAKRWAREGLNT